MGSVDKNQGRDTQAEVAEDFARHVSEHKMVILRDDGLYRHLRFGKPGTSVARFGLVTWPGYLAFVGDMGDYVFARLPDMFEFFRQARPNFSYWAEKVQAADKHSGVMEFSEDFFRESVRENFDHYFDSRDLTEAERQDVWERVEDEVFACLDDGKDVAFAAVRDFEHNGRQVFPDFVEYRMDDYTYRFRWCCHALVWAIRLYDETKAAAEQTAEITPAQ